MVCRVVRYGRLSCDSVSVGIYLSLRMKMYDVVTDKPLYEIVRTPVCEENN